MSLVVNSGGLGAATPQTVDLSPENIAACQNGWYYINPVPCWSMSKDAWSKAAALPALTYPVAAPDAQPCAYSVTQVCTASDGQAASDAAIAQTQANALAAIAAVPDNPLGPDTCEYFGLSCTTLMWLGGIALFAVWALGTAGSGGPRIYAR